MDHWNPIEIFAVSQPNRLRYCVFMKKLLNVYKMC